MQQVRCSAGLVSLVAAGTFVTMPAAASAATARCHGMAATIIGTERSEHLTGTSGRDVVVARGGDDFVDGLGGNDVICGGRGSDHLNGGGGNDTLYGGRDRLSTTDEGSTERVGDILNGGSGNDRLIPGRDTRSADDVARDLVTWATSARPVHIDLTTGRVTGQGSDRISGRPVAVEGSDYDDVITGSTRGDRIYAGGGSDYVVGREGNDVINADSGHRDAGTADRVWGGPGDDQISTAEGDDAVRGGSGNDVLDDFASTIDELRGGPGNDLVVTELAPSGARSQLIDGGFGMDKVNLMTNQINPQALPASGTWNMPIGALSLTLDSAPTTYGGVVIGFEDASLSTYGATWSVTGTAGDDILHAAGTRGTVFTASDGDDEFMGSADGDTFDGGAGTDRSLAMGAGNDTCLSVETFDHPDCENVS